LKRASLETGISEICLAGGVAANKGLRNGLQELGRKMHWRTHVPDLQYCTDNAAMIAITGYHKFMAGAFADLSESASARSAW
jgi:N6-L-threonylcarbamoyladenine synthase